MSEKFDQYTNVLNRLVPEAVACTPQEWTKGTLTITSDGTRMNYKLKNEDQPGIATLSEKLRDLIDELYVRMAHHGDAWTDATICFRQEGDSLKFDTDFQYAKKAPQEVPTMPKPKWKFW